jgi:acyl-CoA thioester hydrolase
MSTKQHSLDQYTTFWTVNVQWGEMDALGHLNNTVYLRYMESARIDYLNRLNFWTPDVAPILKATSCKYIKPIVFPDAVTVGTRISALHTHGFLMEYCIATEKLGVCAIGDANIVAFNYALGTKIELPPAVVQTIQQFEPYLSHQHKP